MRDYIFVSPILTAILATTVLALVNKLSTILALVTIIVIGPLLAEEVSRVIIEVDA